MFAVIKTGGKQYKVAKDDVIVVEKLNGEAGEVVAFESVLMVGEGAETKAGAPFVAGVCVAGEVVEQTRGDKILVFKKKRRQNYRRTNGHRQDLTVVRITDILTDGKKPEAKPKKAAAPKKEAEAKDAGKSAAKKAPAKKAPAKKAAAKKTTAKKAPAKKAAAKKTAKKKDD
jgi:large subunit ribosomal protein L21